MVVVWMIVTLLMVVRNVCWRDDIPGGGLMATTANAFRTRSSVQMIPTAGHSSTPPWKPYSSERGDGG